MLFNRHEKHHHDEAKIEFEKQKFIFDKIKQQSFAAYAESLPNINQAFNLRERSLRCMDEGTPGGIHCAGSGILLGINKAKELYQKANIDGVYSHTGCGAAGLHAKRENLTDKPSDEYGIQFAQNLAYSMGINYLGHIEKLQRPKDFHAARVAYYDTTGTFDFSQIPELPPGFIISRKYLGQEHALEEMQIALQIAFGDHGFGKLITRDNPFYLVPIVSKWDTYLPLSDLTNELNSLTKDYQNKIQIEGLIEV